MTYVTWKIERTDSDDNVTTFTNYSRPILNMNLGDGKDSFSFDIANGTGDWDNYWKARDKVTIYRAVNTDTTTSDDILMVGSVVDTPITDTGSANKLKVKGFNYSEAVMGTIVFVDATDLDVPNAIKKALDNAGLFHPNFKVTWNSNNKLVKRDESTSFPTVGKKYFYKTIKQMLEELSSDEYTADGRYFWYVDNANTLVWKADSSFDADTFNDTTDGYRSKKVGKDTSKVKNFVVGRGGTTPSGQPITEYYPDYTSIAKHGMKYHYFTEDNNLCQTLVKADIVKSGGTEADRYPNLSSTFTTSWKYEGEDKDLAYDTVATNGSTITFDTGTTGSEANSQADYNQALKLHVRAVMKKHMTELVNKTRGGQRKIDLELQPGQKNWGLGSIITVTDSNLGTTPLPLRVDEVQYTTNSDRFSLVEDEGKL